MQSKYTSTLLMAALVAGTFFAGEAAAQREARQDRSTRESKGDYAAYKLLKRSQELLEAGEHERGVKMLETIIEQQAKSPIRFQAYLMLGRHYVENREQAQALDYLRNLQRLQSGKTILTGDDRELYLEGLYLTGVAHFQLRQYSSAFSVLRRITSDYPDTIWANKAYYYIGMSHFAQSHWDKAVKSLSLVGTFVDPDSPTLAFAEAGHRFHVRVTDGDLPVLERLGVEITVEVETTSGDKETIVCKSMSTAKDVLVGSIVTETGSAAAGDGKLQVVGGDSIQVRYLDDNTKSGEKDVPREKAVEVVSTGGVTFTLGTYESLAPAAYLGQPLYLRLWDLDLDKTADKDTATIRIVSQYKAEIEEDLEEPPADAIDVDKLLEEEQEEDRYVIRDEVILKVSEAGEVPVHEGVFIGRVPVERFMTGQPVNQDDQVLSADLGDEIVAIYVDDSHILGKTPIEVTAKLMVSGEIDSSPRAAQDVVPDALVKARKQLIEAEAFLELAKIFKNMGLMDGAQSKAGEGLQRVEDIIHVRQGIPAELKENAFRLKWELHLSEDQFGKAMATCNTFNRAYPESPLVDHALMGMARVLEEKKDLEGAIQVWRQVTRLPNSHSKAAAQFKIAEAIDQQDNRDTAVREYMACAQKYPDSEFAGRALGKVIDYHVASGAYDVADDLLEQIFIDYQDEDFLDQMLSKWVVVAIDSGNIKKAHAKCRQLISEYPGSEYTALIEQNDTLSKIEAKLDKEGEDNEK
jgi:TolA-binding protein